MAKLTKATWYLCCTARTSKTRVCSAESPRTARNRSMSAAARRAGWYVWRPADPIDQHGTALCPKHNTPKHHPASPQRDPKGVE
jgi:hypothetical protein